MACIVPFTPPPHLSLQNGAGMFQPVMSPSASPMEMEAIGIFLSKFKRNHLKHECVYVCIYVDVIHRYAYIHIIYTHTIHIFYIYICTYIHIFYISICK